MSDLMQLEKRLEPLADWKQVALCAALTERMYPNFALFSRLVEFGDAQQVRQILNGVWDYLAQTGAKMNFEVQLDKVEANVPDLDEFTMYGASPAYDAVIALISTLNNILQVDSEEVANVANLSRECVATFIEVTEGHDQLSDEELVRLIETHPLMEQEDAFRNSVLEQLEAAGQNPKQALIEGLRSEAANEGISNIGISDED